MLPVSAGRQSSSLSLPEYLRRIVHYPQMDIEYTFWQMLYLCINPWRVYVAAGVPIARRASAALLFPPR